MPANLTYSDRSNASDMSERAQAKANRPKRLLPLIALAILILSQLACDGTGRIGDPPSYHPARNGSLGTYHCPAGQYLGSDQSGSYVCRYAQ
jgi:hypothetical protein